jgi:uncharacterized LabA/DUF88 family protein
LHLGLSSPTPPSPIRAVAFVDGQNLFHSAKSAFGYSWPNYDPLALSNQLCSDKGWRCDQVRFYTGVPDMTDDPFWNHFWVAKGAQMGREGIVVYTRQLMYRNKVVTLPDGTKHTFLDGDEKGIDLRIALDVIRLAHARTYDVALVFCRDQDFSELADEIKVISLGQNRWIKMASAFPYSPVVRHFRGIDGTEWIRITRDVYDACLDLRDYRPKSNDLP